VAVHHHHVGARDAVPTRRRAHDPTSWLTTRNNAHAILQYLEQSVDKDTISVPRPAACDAIVTMMSWLTRWRRRRALARALGYRAYVPLILLGFPLVLSLVVYAESITGGDPFNIAVWSVVIGLMLVIAPIYVFQRRRAVGFAEHLDSHREQLRGGGTVPWRGHELAYNTELTRFEITVSVVLWTIRVPTAFALATPPPTQTLWTAQLLTAVFGWWGIPAGPFMTIASLVRNGRGGYRSSVAQLLNELSA
jgi:hypothetical protein